MNKTDILLQAGFSMREIQSACSAEATTLINAGFSTNEVNESVNRRYGLSMVRGLDADSEALMCVSDVVDNALKLERKEEKKEGYKIFGGAPTIFDNDIDQLVQKLKESLDKGFEAMAQAKEEAGDALLTGYQHSNLGLVMRGRNPDGSLPIDSSLLEKTFFGLGQAAGDLPTYVAGAAAGLFTANPLAIGAASFGMTEGARKYLMLKYKNGEATTPQEAWDMTNQVLLATGKGALTGAMSVGGGLLFAKGATKVVNSAATNAMAQALKARPNTTVVGAGLVGEELSATTTSSLLEGRLPTKEDFILSGIMLGTFHASKYYAKGGVKAISEIVPGLSTLYQNRLMRLYEVTGKTPQEVLELTLLDPKSRLNMYSLNYEPASQVAMREIKKATKDTSPYLKGTRLFTTAEGVDTKTKKPVTVLGEQTKAVTDKYVAESIEKTRAEAGGVEAKPINEFILSDKDVVMNVDKKFMEHSFKSFLKTPEGQEYFLVNYSQKQLEKVNYSSEYAYALAKEMYAEPTPEFLNFISKSEDLAYLSKAIEVDPLDPKNKLEKDSPEYVTAANERTAQFTNFYSKTKGPTALKMPDGSYIIMQPEKLKAAKDIPLEKPRFIKGRKVGSKEIDLDSAKKSIEKYISFDEKRPKSFRQLAAEFRQAFIDQFAALNTGAEKGKMNIAYFAALRTKYDGALSEYIIKRDRVKFGTDEVLPGKTLQDIVLSVPDRRDLSIYLVARKQVELYNRGAKEDLLAVPLDDAMKVVKEFDNIPEYKQAALDLDSYMDYLKEYTKDAGLITEKALAKYRAENDTKAPIYTLPDFLVPILKDETVAKSLFSTLGVKDEKGLRYKYYDDPIATSIALTYSVVSTALKNEALKMAGMQFGAPITDAAKSGAYTKISYFEKGKYTTKMVPTEIKAACANMSRQNSKLMGSFFGKSLLTKPAKIANSGAVLFWDFLTKATFIDQYTAAIQSKTGYVPFVDMFKGFAASINHATNGRVFKNYDGIVDEWWRSGGYSAGIVAADRNSAKEVLKQLTSPSAINVIKDPIKYYKDFFSLLNVPGHALNFLRGASEQLDRATRLGEYMRATKAGMTPREAAMSARDVTTDYKRMGAVGQAYNQITTFFNASIQGTDKFVRAFAHDPVTTAVRTAAYLGIPSFLLAMVRADIEVNNPDSEQAMVLSSIPTWQRTAYWILPAGDTVIRIPKPYGYMIASSLVEGLVEYAVKEDANFLNSMYEEGFIESIERTFMPDFIPAAVKPLLETKTNYRFFSEGPIVPLNAENMVNEEQYTMGTSEVAKIIGRSFAAINAATGLPIPDRLQSPLVIDNLIRGYTASLGTTTVELLDNALRAAGVVKNVEPAKSIEDMPLFKTFMYKFGPHAKQITDFYKEEQELSKVYNSIRRLARSSDPAARARGEALMERPFANLTPIRTANSNINKQIVLIYENPEIPAEEKASYINELYKRKVLICNRGLEIIKYIKQQFEEK